MYRKLLFGICPVSFLSTVRWSVDASAKRSFGSMKEVVTPVPLSLIAEQVYKGPGAVELRKCMIVIPVQRAEFGIENTNLQVHVQWKIKPLHIRFLDADCILGN